MNSSLLLRLMKLCVLYIYVWGFSICVLELLFYYFF